MSAPSAAPPLPPAPPPSKPPLLPEELREVMNLSLWSGQLLLQYGADAQRIEETVHRLGTALGADWLDIHIHPGGLVISVSSGINWRTRARRGIRQEVDLAIVAEVNRLSRQVAAGALNRAQLDAELRRVSQMHPIYPRWFVAVVMGFACGGFSQLFGGDWRAFVITVVAATAAGFLRQQLMQRNINSLLMTVVSAFVAGVLASSALIFDWSATPQVPLAASVLFLVPGVPLLNSVEDLIYGHVAIGWSRALLGALLSLGIALGLWLAIFMMERIVP